MNKDQIDKAIQQERLPLTVFERIDHYAFVIVILFIPAILLYQKITANEISDEVPVFEMLLIALAVYFVYHKYKSLKFEKFEIEHDISNFNAAATATAKELGWKIITLEENCLIANKYLPWQWDGLRITIIRDQHALYMNSIVEPSLRSNPFSFGWNGKNIKVFKDNLLFSIEGKDIVKLADEKVKRQKRKERYESEWTFKNTLKRLIAYFCIFILFGACAIILSVGIHPFTILAVIIIGGSSIGYLVIDIIIVVRKMRKKRQKKSQ